MEYVLGRTPAPNVSLSRQLTNLARWICSCHVCKQGRVFFSKSVQGSMTLERIGAPARKHVEGYLATYARSLATWDLVRTTPQSLSVRVQLYSGSPRHRPTWSSLDQKIRHNVSADRREKQADRGDERTEEHQQRRRRIEACFGDHIQSHCLDFGFLGVTASSTCGSCSSHSCGDPRRWTVYRLFRPPYRLFRPQANVPQPNAGPAAKKQKVSHDTGEVIH